MRTKSFWTALALLLVTLVSCQCSKDAPQKHPDTFALLFTTSVEGWVEPCGCTSNPLGGVARLATVVLQAKDRYGLGTLLVDGGDLLFDSVKAKSPTDLCQEKARVDLLLSSLYNLSILGTFVGPFDNAMGPEFLESYLKRHKIQDLTLAARDGILAGPATFKIALFFIDEKNAAEVNAKAAAMKNKGAQAAVAVTHLSRNSARDIARSLNSVDAVILALAKDETPVAPEKPEAMGPILVSAAKQGQYLGILEFHKNDTSDSRWQLDNRQQLRESRISLLTQRQATLENQIKDSKEATQLAFLRERLDEVKEELKEIETENHDASLSGNFMKPGSIALSRQVSQNPIFEANLKKYEEQIPELTALCEASTECPKADENQPTYVGAETCRTCHSAAYDFWSKAIHNVPASDDKGKTIIALSGHTKAWKTLEDKGKVQDRSCVECHSTGFMQPGGYCKVKEVGKLKNVQCEACHGAGSMHAATANKRFIKRDVPESTCRQCHHVPHIATTESFVYSEKLQYILGKGHGELFLAKIKHEAQN